MIEDMWELEVMSTQTVYDIVLTLYHAAIDSRGKCVHCARAWHSARYERSSNMLVILHDFNNPLHLVPTLATTL